MKKMKRTDLLRSILIIALSCYGCRDVAVPRPRGFFRIDLPAKEYRIFGDSGALHKDLPIRFEYPVYGKITFEGDQAKEPGWLNIEFPSYKAKIYLTYKHINNNFAGLMEQTYKMNVKNHVTKADAIKNRQ
jgi:gliding motility-associated lipoprotein GldD